MLIGIFPLLSFLCIPNIYATRISDAIFFHFLFLSECFDSIDVGCGWSGSQGSRQFEYLIFIPQVIFTAGKKISKVVNLKSENKILESLRHRNIIDPVGYIARIDCYCGYDASS